MSEKDPKDPFALWREAAQLQEQQFSKLFESAASSETFGESLRKAMESYLSATQVSRENMERYLTAANMPTRGDVARLSERIEELTNRIEELASELRRKP